MPQTLQCECEYRLLTCISSAIGLPKLNQSYHTGRVSEALDLTLNSETVKQIACKKSCVNVAMHVSRLS